MYRQESLPGQGLVVLTALDRVIIPWGRAGYIVPRLVTRTAESCQDKILVIIVELVLAGNWWRQMRG